MRWIVLAAAVLVLLAGPFQAAAQATSSDTGHCPGGRSKNAALWLSIGHPGLGEWYLNGWGSFSRNAPQRKFWLGFIPGYGWPGYLQVKSAIDAANCRTNDDLAFRD